MNKESFKILSLIVLCVFLANTAAAQTIKNTKEITHERTVCPEPRKLILLPTEKENARRVKVKGENVCRIPRNHHFLRVKNK
ncbi:MAG: hypothetical protein ACPGU5_05655 [Lishizhenia sp.]